MYADLKGLLFDEPLSNLDARLRRHMRAETKNLQRKAQATIIYVAHDLEKAMTLGSRLVVMNRGLVQQCGTPIDIYNHPDNRCVSYIFGGHLPVSELARQPTSKKRWPLQRLPWQVHHATLPHALDDDPGVCGPLLGVRAARLVEFDWT